MLEAVKKALGVTFNDLDDDITSTIKSARAELVRSGILLSKVEDETDDLVTMAIKTYCKSVYTSDVTRSRDFMESFKYQQDCLRKTTGYSDV